MKARKNVEQAEKAVGVRSNRIDHVIWDDPADTVGPLTLGSDTQILTPMQTTSLIIPAGTVISIHTRTHRTGMKNSVLCRTDSFCKSGIRCA